MKTLSTLFIAAALAFSVTACGGGSESEAAESQSDDTMTTGDETATDDAYGDPAADDGYGDEAATDDGMGDPAAEEGATDEAATDDEAL